MPLAKQGPGISSLPTATEVASDFGRAMSELTAIQARLAEEHVQEVTMLHNVISQLTCKVSDLEARIRNFTSMEESSHLDLIPTERGILDLLAVSHHCSLVNSAQGSPVVTIAAPCPSNGVPKQMQISECQSKNNRQSSSFPSLDGHAPVYMSENYDLDCRKLSGSAVDTDVDSGTLVSNNDVVLDLDAEDVHRLSAGKADIYASSDEGAISGESSVIVASKTDSASDQSVTTSRRGSGSRRVSFLSSMLKNQSKKSYRCEGMAAVESEKAEKRAQRLRTVLQARLRSIWIVDEEIENFVASWSQTSSWSDCSDDSNVFEHREGTIRPGDGIVKRSSNRGGSITLKRQVICVIHPQSRSKVLFDFLGILIILYDFCVTPLMFFDLPESAFLTVMGWVTRIFWTSELWLNFHTATYMRGVLEFRFRKIAMHYLKTMFLLDFAIVFTEWLAYVLERTSHDARSLDNLYLLRILKALRFAKVMRVFKFEQIMRTFRAQINSTLLLLWMKPLIVALFLLIWNHSLACVWYGIGTSSDGWTEKMAENSSFAYMYVTALHWAVSQLHGNMEVFPQNLPERLFMCLNAIIAMILYSSFLSSITNGMLQIHALRAELHERQTKLRAVLARRNASAQLTMHIKKRLDYIAEAKAELDSEASILALLPKDLLMDLYEESRKPVVVEHNFFYLLNSRRARIMRQLCHDAMSESSYCPQLVFSAGDACLGMSFVTSGEFLYEIRQSRRTYASCALATASATSESIMLQASSAHEVRGTGVNSITFDETGTLVSADPAVSQRGGQVACRGDWLSEAVLWMTWEYCGNLTARTPALLLVVDAVRFAEIVSQFQSALVNSTRYARDFIETMVKHGVRTDFVPREKFS